MLLAQGKVGRAATEDAQLRQRAEANARGTIAALIRGLGFTDVVVDFEPLSAA